MVQQGFEHLAAQWGQARSTLCTELLGVGQLAGDGTFAQGIGRLGHDGYVIT